MRSAQQRQPGRRRVALRVIAVAKRRLAPMSNEVWVSGGCPCASYINWPANLSSAEAVRPPNEMLGAMLIIRSSASSVTWSRHDEADPPVRVSLRRALARCHFVRNATCLLRHLRAVNERPIRLEQVQVGRVFPVRPQRPAAHGCGEVFPPRRRSDRIRSLTTCRAASGRRSR